MEKDKKTSREINQLRKRVSDMPEDKKKLAYRLIDEVVYMGETITELKKMVKYDGVVIDVVNGNGFITQAEHPAQKSYNTTIKNYLSSIKQLNELMPDSKAGEVVKAGKALTDFIQAGKK